MVEMDTDSEFISGMTCFEKKIRHLTILSEGSLVDGKDFGGASTKKLEFLVECKEIPGMRKKWRPNQTAKKSLKKLFGDDSKFCLGKIIKINLSPYENKYSIIVDEIDTMALNNVGTATVQTTIPSGTATVSTTSNQQNPAIIR